MTLRAARFGDQLVLHAASTRFQSARSCSTSDRAYWARARNRGLRRPLINGLGPTCNTNPNGCLVENGETKAGGSLLSLGTAVGRTTSFPFVRMWVSPCVSLWLFSQPKAYP